MPILTPRKLSALLDPFHCSASVQGDARTRVEAGPTAGETRPAPVNGGARGPMPPVDAVGDEYAGGESIVVPRITLSRMHAAMQDRLFSRLFPHDEGLAAGVLP